MCDEPRHEQLQSGQHPPLADPLQGGGAPLARPRIQAVRIARVGLPGHLRAAAHLPCALRARKPRRDDCPLGPALGEPHRPLPPLRGRTDGAEGRRAARYFVPGDDAPPGGVHLAYGERGGGAARDARTGLGALPRRFSRIGGAGFRPGSASAGLPAGRLSRVDGTSGGAVFQCRRERTSGRAASTSSERSPGRSPEAPAPGIPSRNSPVSGGPCPPPKKSPLARAVYPKNKPVRGPSAPFWRSRQRKRH